MREKSSLLSVCMLMITVICFLLPGNAFATCVALEMVSKCIDALPQFNHPVIDFPFTKEASQKNWSLKDRSMLYRVPPLLLTESKIPEAVLMQM